MNSLNAVGNIGKDAELRYTSGDKPTPVAQFSFALTSGYGQKAITTWLNCSVWGDRAKTLAPMLTKGTKIGITGELTNRPYTDKQGVEKYSLELRVSDVTLLGTKGDKPAEDRPERNIENPTYVASDGVKEAFDNFEDDVPF